MTKAKKSRNQNDKTLIEVNKKTVERLKKIKIVSKESYEEVITRLLNMEEEMVQNVTD